MRHDPPDEDHGRKAHLKDVHDDVPPDYYDVSMKTNLIQRLYHGRRFNALCELASRANGRLLDVGCDGGTLLARIADKAKPSTVIALDLSSEAVKYTLVKRPDFSGLVGDGEALPFSNDAFQAIFCSEVMEHIERPVRLF